MTYPSTKATFCPKQEVGVNVDLGEGYSVGGHFPETLIDPVQFNNNYCQEHYFFCEDYFDNSHLLILYTIYVYYAVACLYQWLIELYFLSVQQWQMKCVIST